MTNTQSIAVPTASALIIGNEILSGRTKDANIHTLALKLASVGIKLLEVRVVPDIEQEIIDAVNALRSRYTYVFTTGGIGPTHDDITAVSIAKAFNLPVIEHPEARALLESFYTAKNMTPARLLMARTPEGASLIENPSTKAPGFIIENVYVMAGVPSIMEAMVDSVLQKLRHGPLVHSLTIYCQMPESIFAEDLGLIASKHPSIDIGSYPSFHAEGISAALVVRGIDKVEINQVGNEIQSLIISKGGLPVIEDIK